MENQPIGNHGLGIFWCGRIELGSSFKIKQGKPSLKVLITHLLLVLDDCNVKCDHGPGII